MKYQICPICRTKVAIEHGKKISICPSNLCPNPYMFSCGKVIEEDNELLTSSYKDASLTDETSDGNIIFRRLILKNVETATIHKFDCPAILNRSSFSPKDYAISENEHAFVDCLDENYLVTDASTYQATWINSQRLNTGVSGILSCGDILRIGNTFLEVLHEHEF